MLSFRRAGVRAAQWMSRCLACERPGFNPQLLPEQGSILYLLLRPHLDGAPACLNRINLL